MSKHTFTIEVEFDDSYQYEQFLHTLMAHGAEVVDEESDM
jgi:hypothetical protein